MNIFVKGGKGDK